MTDLSREDKLIKDIRYEFSDTKTNLYIGPMKLSLHDDAQKVLDDVIVYLREKSETAPCEECEGAGYFGVSIDGTGSVERVPCVSCNGSGVVPVGHIYNPAAESYYADAAHKKFYG